MTQQSQPTAFSAGELEAAGWKRRSLLAHDRMVEADLIYQKLGLETLIRAADASDLGPECGSCQSHACSEYEVIYTREKTS